MSASFPLTEDFSDFLIRFFVVDVLIGCVSVFICLISPLTHENKSGTKLDDFLQEGTKSLLNAAFKRQVPSTVCFYFIINRPVFFSVNRDPDNEVVI